MRLSRRIAECMRPCIGMVAAFGLALQVLLSGVLAAQFDATAAAGDTLVICLGAGAPSDDGAPAKSLDHHQPCVLCTLAKAAHALLPTIEPSAVLDARLIAVVGPALTVQVARYASPTGHYQRGPPALSIAG